MHELVMICGKMWQDVVRSLKLVRLFIKTGELISEGREEKYIVACIVVNPT